MRELVSGSRRRRQRGATMAKYKSKSRPPSFLTSPLPSQLCTGAPLSSSFVHPARHQRGLRQSRRSLPRSLSSLSSISLVFHSQRRPGPLCALPYSHLFMPASTPASVFRFNSPPRAPAREFLLYSPSHFGF